MSLFWIFCLGTLKGCNLASSDAEIVLGSMGVWIPDRVGILIGEGFVVQC